MRGVTRDGYMKSILI